jgi:hypothetical protein
MRRQETFSVAVRWTEIALDGATVYGVSEKALSVFLANNPKRGLLKREISPHMRCLPWTGSKTGQPAERLDVMVWYLCVPSDNRIEVIAISDPRDAATDPKKNATDASSMSKKLAALRNGYFGYRVGKVVYDHWPDIKDGAIDIAKWLSQHL